MPMPPAPRYVTSDRRTLPIVHSILHADAVCEVIAQHWDLPKPLFCELLARGMNDNYLLRCGSEQLAVRLWNARGRTGEEIDYELDFIDFLQAEGLPVSPAIKTKDGENYVAIEAPEGRRYIGLFAWAQGRELIEVLSGEYARQLGELMGRLHLVSPRFPGGNSRLLGHADLIREQFPAVAQRVAHRPDDLAFYTRVAEALPKAIDAMGEAAPMAPTHGDMTVFNVFEQNGKLILMDFETCGYGHLSHELGSFCWSANKNRFPPEIAQNYLAAYDAVRPRAKAEKDLFPLFLCMKDFTQLCGLSASINAIGWAGFKFKGFDWAIDSVRRHVAAAKLL